MHGLVDEIQMLDNLQNLITLKYQISVQITIVLLSVTEDSRNPKECHQ